MNRDYFPSLPARSGEIREALSGKGLQGIRGSSISAEIRHEPQLFSVRGVGRLYLGCAS